MALSRPRAQFAHRRTVRLIVDNDIESIDALKLAKSLPHFSGDIKGIVPLFGGKCFDITLATSEAAAKLAQEGLEYENSHKSLRLLGQRSIHVSVFVTVEFPDEDLLNLLATYGELNSRTVRHLYFTEEGFTHIENGIRVVQFKKIDRDIPKRVVLGGLEIGFKYSGQPVTCHRCQSTEHVVKDCPKRRPPRPPPPQQDPGGDPTDSMDTAPSLFTQSYASATAGNDDSSLDVDDTDETDADWSARMQSEEEAAMAELKIQRLRELAELNASRGRKRGGPPSTSDDEHQAPKKPVTPETTTTEETATIPDDPPAQENSTPPTPSPTPPSPAGLRHFMAAMQSTGWQRSALMKAIPGDVYYRCRGYYLYHKHGNYTTAQAKASNVKNEKEKTTWGALQGTIKQDAFATLVTTFIDLQKKHGIFTSD